MENKHYPTTPIIRKKRNYYNTLANNLSVVLEDGIFRRRKMEDKILFLRTISDAERDMWEAVYKEYPELIGKDLQMDSWEIFV